MYLTLKKQNVTNIQISNKEYNISYENGGNKVEKFTGKKIHTIFNLTILLKKY